MSIEKYFYLRVGFILITVVLFCLKFGTVSFTKLLLKACIIFGILSFVFFLIPTIILLDIQSIIRHFVGSVLKIDTEKGDTVKFEIGFSSKHSMIYF
jgi:hypothetical protein